MLHASSLLSNLTCCCAPQLLSKQSEDSLKALSHKLEKEGIQVQRLINSSNFFQEACKIANNDDGGSLLTALGFFGIHSIHSIAFQDGKRCQMVSWSSFTAARQVLCMDSRDAVYLRLQQR